MQILNGRKLPSFEQKACHTITLTLTCKRSTALGEDTVLSVTVGYQDSEYNLEGWINVFPWWVVAVELDQQLLDDTC